MGTIIRDENLKKVGDNVKPDAKRRLVLPRGIKCNTYNIYINNIGQIVLDPQVSIPAAEAWLFENKEALASVRRGLSDAAQGKIEKIDIDAL
jgi:hypothetical protein